MLDKIVDIGEDCDNKSETIATSMGCQVEYSGNPCLGIIPMVRNEPKNDPFESVAPKLFTSNGGEGTFRYDCGCCKFYFKTKFKNQIQKIYVPSEVDKTLFTANYAQHSIHYLTNNGIVEIYRNQRGSLHNNIGPAEIYYYPNGQKRLEKYYINGAAHNENGPAIVSYSENGTVDQEYYSKNGKNHRSHGPAFIDYVTGREEWHLDGVYIRKFEEYVDRAEQGIVDYVTAMTITNRKQLAEAALEFGLNLKIISEDLYNALKVGIFLRR